MPLSLDALLDRYQAIQQILLVRLQDTPFSDVEPYWADSQASYYNKRGGRRNFTLNNVLDLLRGLHYEDELALVNLLAECRSQLWKELHGIPPSLIRCLPMKEELINQLLLIRIREESNWELPDLRLVVEVLRTLIHQMQRYVDLPSHIIEQHQSN